MPPYRCGAVDSRSVSVRPSGRNTGRNAEFVILRSPENITDVDSDTEEDWDREYRPKINRTHKPTKKATRSPGPAGDVVSLVDLEDYSPRGPSRKRKRAKVGSSSKTSTLEDRASFVESIVSGGDSSGPSEEGSEDDDDDASRKASKIAGRSRANRKEGKAKERADTIVCALSTDRKSTTQKIESTQRKRYKRTASYEAKTAERVAEIAAKKAPHLVALARINAEAEQLREQLRMKKQEREIMEKVWGVVRSREKSQIGSEKKIETPKTTVWTTDSEDDAPMEFSASIEVGRNMLLLGQELQEESEGWNSLFDESEKMSGVDSIKVDEPTLPQPKKRISRKSQETSGTGEKSQNQVEKSKPRFEENTDRELAEQNGTEPTAGFSASDNDSLFGDSKTVPVRGRRGKFKETKSLRKPKISQQEKRGPSDPKSIHEEAEKRRCHGQKRKYLFEANTDGELGGRRGSQKTPRFLGTENDSFFDGTETQSERKSRWPAGDSLSPQDEKVANESRVEYEEPGDTKKAGSSLSNCQRLGERVGESPQELAASELGVGQRELGVRHLGLQEAVGGGGDGSAQEVREDLRTTECLECPDGKQSSGGTGDELDRVDEEIDMLLKGCGVGSASLHDHQKSPERYDIDLFDTLPEMSWGKLAGVGDGGDSSTIAEHAITNSMRTGPGAPGGELELAQKQLEKDLGFMDWDRAEAEFLKFDDDALLYPAAEDPKKDVGLDGVEEQGRGMEDRTRSSKRQHCSPELLPQDIPEESAREKFLGCLDQEKRAHRFGRPGGRKNKTSGKADRVGVYNPMRVHNSPRSGPGRARSRPYTMKEISEYSLASLFETYKDEIEKMEIRAAKSMKSSAARRGGETKSQGEGVGNALEEKPKADALTDLHRDGAYESEAEAPRVDTPSEWGDYEKNGRPEQGVGVRDDTPSPLESRETAERKKVEGKITDTTTGSLGPAGQRKESSGSVGVNVSAPEEGEIIEPEKKVPDSISLNVYPAELPVSSDRGSSMDSVLHSDFAVFPGETAKLYRVELPDGSMGYVLAEMVSGEWRMTFITDAPGDGYGKTQRSPPELCSDGDLLWEDAERARKSPKGMRQSSFLERARSGSPKTRARDSGDRSDGRNLRLERRRSQSPVLMRAFQESNIRDVEEEEQQDLGSSKQKLDTEDRRADSNDWD